jgi:uncharacterized protein YecE (DUF72 family)
LRERREGSAPEDEALLRSEPAEARDLPEAELLEFSPPRVVEVRRKPNRRPTSAVAGPARPGIGPLLWERTGPVPVSAMPSRKARARIGCSGWFYQHWRGDFYPRDLPQNRWLGHYATIFDTVEVNNSFYRLPEAATFESWAGRVPGNFLFAVKASRYLTHGKKLKDPKGPLDLFFERAAWLGRKLGPVLYQLPPRWPRNLTRLEEFLEALPKDRLQAIEFRERSWYGEEVYRALHRAGVALCLHDMAEARTPLVSPGPFVYLRFHGAGTRYGGRYPAATLTRWARWIAERLEERRDVYAYFNNDAQGHAPRDAVRLRRRLEDLTGGPASHGSHAVFARTTPRRRIFGVEERGRRASPGRKS